MKNPLFLQFCLWFLCHSKKYFDFHRGQDIYKYLRDFCVNKLNGVDIDIPHIRETYMQHLMLKQLVDRNDQLRLNFLRDIFVSCDKMSSIVVDDALILLDWVLNSLGLLLRESDKHSIQRQRSYLARVNSALVTCKGQTS